MSATPSLSQPLLQLQGVSAGGIVVPDLVADHGSIVVLTLAREEIGTWLMRLMLGLELPERGTVRLFGEELATKNERELGRLRQRVGLVPAGGGLVSNLKVVENLLLPVLYHNHQPKVQAEERAVTLLQRVGYLDHPMRLPGLLTLFQKKQVALARSMMLDPELMVYVDLSHGVTVAERDRLLGITEAFHGERPGRASLYLTLDRKLAERFDNATVIHLNSGAKP